LAVEPRETIPLKWFGRFTLGIVRRGLLIRQRTDARGRVTAVDVVGPGGVFPIEQRRAAAQDSSMAAGYAATRTLICLCDGESIFGSLRAGGETALDLHNLYADALYRMERLADARARPNTDARVAALLCALVDTLAPHVDPNPRVPAGFLQRDLAALLSMRHESVCRVLRAFGERGFISRDTDGMQILDRQQLAAV
jgi:CRP-like cAMP-binding protein